MRRFIVLTLSIVLSAGLLFSAPTTAQAATKTTVSTPKVSPAKPVRGQAFSVTGSLSTKVVRAVRLERKSGSKWVTLASAKSNKTGAFTIKTSTTLTSLSLRVVAIAVKIKTKSYAQGTSKAVAVTTVPAPVPPTITTKSLPGAVVGTSYSAVLTASSGTSPYTWSTTGLPAGISLNTTTGSLTGTPTTTGAYQVNVTVKDRNTKTATARLTLTVTPAVSITTKALPGGVINATYSAGLAATGGTSPYTWSTTGLPAGISLNTTTGSLTGTPTTTGDYRVNITVKDRNTKAATATFDLKVTTPTPINDGIQLSAAVDYACALMPVGTVRCWGENREGQLGNTVNTLTENPNPTPTQVAGLSGVTAISGGQQHMCALMTNKTVKCWGYNYERVLGHDVESSDPDLADALVNPVPNQVVGLNDVIAISAGRWFTCALVAEGSVKCWGNNDHGQVGTTNNPTTTPTTVAGLSNVVAIRAGGYHACAVISDGTVKCWGNNQDGQLGNTTNSDCSADECLPNPTPTTVAGLTGVVALSAGNSHTCARTDTGTVKCWGTNGSGQTGADDLLAVNPVPYQIPELTNIVALASGGEHSCAASESGEVLCWGDDGYGQLGDGHESNYAHPAPMPVDGIGNVASIGGGEAFTCAASSTDGVKCWGNNGFGQLGNGTTVSAFIPTATIGLNP